MKFLQFFRSVTSTLMLKAQTVTSAVTSTVYLDTSLYEGDILVSVNSAKGTGNADNVLTPTVVSDDASGGSYATTEATLGTILGTGGTDKVVTAVIPANQGKRYWKVTLTPAGTSPSFLASVTFHGKKRIKA